LRLNTQQAHDDLWLEPAHLAGDNYCLTWSSPRRLTMYLLAAVAVFWARTNWRAAFARPACWSASGLHLCFCLPDVGGAGKSFNLTGMLSSSLVRATPIALAALCGVISERSAVINIGIEGIMLIAAQTAVVSPNMTGNLYWFGSLPPS
jgi:hypothetical protein